MNLHPLVNDRTTAIRPPDLLRFLDSCGHDYAVADLGPHRLQHLQRQPAAIGERTAVAVAAPVAEPRQELAEQVAVGQVDLQPVESGGDQAAGRAAVGVREFGDVAAIHGVRHDLAGRVGHGRRRPQFPVRGERVPLAPEVGELAEDGGALGLDHPGDAGVRRDARIAVDLVDAGGGQARGVHHGGPLDHQADAPGGPFGQVMALPLGEVVGMPVHEARAVAGEDHAVADLQRADPQRAEQQRVGRRGGRGGRRDIRLRRRVRTHRGGPGGVGTPRGRSCRSRRRGLRPGRCAPR